MRGGVGWVLGADYTTSTCTYIKNFSTSTKWGGMVGDGCRVTRGEQNEAIIIPSWWEAQVTQTLSFFFWLIFKGKSCNLEEI